MSEQSAAGSDKSEAVNATEAGWDEAPPASAEQTPRAVSPPFGFGKGVNEYLNHYVTVADAKAVAVLAASLAVGQALLSMNLSTQSAVVSRLITLVPMLISVGVSTACLFPRLPGGGAGLIFWEDVRHRSTLAEYADEIARLDEASVEREYASQNWYVSNVLHKKHLLVRWAIGGLLVGLVGTLATYILR